MVVLVLLIVGMALERWINVASNAAGLVSVLSGDPTVYETRWNQIASGQLPYIDVPFEHFPLTIVPMGVAGALSEVLGVTYTAAWALVTSALIVASVWVMHSIAQSLDDRAIVSCYLMLLAPLLPLALFRTDILPVVLAAAALFAMLRGRDLSGSITVIAGVLAKGWPVVLAVVDWWRGNRLRAVLSAGVTVLVVGALLSTPGFRAGRSFNGVHQETVSGSLILAWRQLTGSELGVLDYASAVYLEAGVWAVTVNLLLGAGLVGVALRGMRHPFHWRGAATLIAAVVLAALLASPLLSAQFLMWPIAFLAIDARRPVVWAMVVASIATVALLGFWDREALWWAMLLIGRNSVLIAVALATAMQAAQGTTRPPRPREAPS